MKPKLIISEDVYKKVMHWVNKSKYEVSGFGTVVVDKNGVLRVTDAMLLPQKNGSTHTDIEADAVCKALYDMRNADGEMKWWWHSHVMMGVFWSGTDHQAMKDFSGTPESWMICTVFNQKKELKSAYYAHDGIETPWGKTPLFYDDLETVIEAPLDPRVAEWDAAYEANVTNVMVSYQPVKVWDARQSTWQGKGQYLTKKERKQAKKEAKKDDVKPTPAYAVDEYGYDQSDRILLNTLGYDEAKIKDLVDYDFTPLELLALAESNIYAEEVICMVRDMGFNPMQIMDECRSTVDRGIKLASDDVPVADRKNYDYYDETYGRDGWLL